MLGHVGVEVAEISNSNLLLLVVATVWAILLAVVIHHQLHISVVRISMPQVGYTQCSSSSYCGGA